MPTIRELIRMASQKLVASGKATEKSIRHAKLKLKASTLADLDDEAVIDLFIRQVSIEQRKLDYRAGYIDSPNEIEELVKILRKEVGYVQ